MYLHVSVSFTPLAPFLLPLAPFLLPLDPFLSLLFELPRRMSKEKVCLALEDLQWQVQVLYLRLLRSLHIIEERLLHLLPLLRKS